MKSFFLFASCAMALAQKPDYNRNLQNQPAFTITASQCACDGVTDDTAPIKAWLATVATRNPIEIDFVGKSVYVPSATVSAPIVIPSNVTLRGPGGFVGVPFSIVPTTTIVIQGALGASYPYTSTIANNTINFTFSNGFSAGQMFFLSNFPYDTANSSGTYPQGSDTCTLTNGTCSYPKNVLGNNSSGQGVNNQRQYRRREVGEIRSSTGSAIVAMYPVVNDYTSTTALQFQSVTPVENVRFRDVDMSQIFVSADLTRNVSIRGGKWYQSTASATRSLRFTFDVDALDAASTDSSVNCGGGSRGWTVRGQFSGAAISSDNGLVRVDQCADVNIDVVSGGTSGNAYPIIIDTDYDEDPLGYPLQPDYNVRINLVGSSTSDTSQSTLCLFLAGNPYYAPIYNANVSFTGNVGCTVQAKGLFNSSVSVLNPNAGLSVASSSNSLFSGFVHTFYGWEFADNLGIASTTFKNAGLTFQDIIFRCQISDTSSNDTYDWWFHSMVDVRWYNVTLDMSNCGDNNPPIRFSNYSNGITIGTVHYLGNGSGTHTVACDGAVGPLTVLGGFDGIFSGCPVALPVASGAITPPSVTYSQLSGLLSTYRTGSQLYCTDCTVATTCSGSGSGHMAVKNASAWTCQ